VFEATVRMLSLSLALVFSPLHPFFFEFTGLKMRKWREIDFLAKHFAGRLSCVTLVETFS